MLEKQVKPQTYCDGCGKWVLLKLLMFHYQSVTAFVGSWRTDSLKAHVLTADMK